MRIVTQVSDVAQGPLVSVNLSFFFYQDEYHNSLCEVCLFCCSLCCRILEFESQTNSRQGVDVELWDVSGDPK